MWSREVVVKGKSQKNLCIEWKKEIPCIEKWTTSENRKKKKMNQNHDSNKWRVISNWFLWRKVNIAHSKIASRNFLFHFSVVQNASDSDRSSDYHLIIFCIVLLEIKRDFHYSTLAQGEEKEKKKKSEKYRRHSDVKWKMCVLCAYMCARWWW